MIDSDERPLVSVIIASFNYGHFVEEAIRSALAQTYPNVEIILVDDGSTDGTAERVGPFRELRNFVYLFQENQKTSAARNHGLRHARGKLVALLDADDVWMPEKLSAQVAQMRADSSIALSCTDYEVIEDSGSRRPSEAPLEGLEKAPNQLRWLIRRMCILPSTAVFRRDVLESLGGFEESLGDAAERALFVRIAREHRIGVVRKPLVRYRRHEGNATRLLNEMIPWDVLAFERMRRGWIPLSAEERADVDRFLVDRYRRLVRYHLREGRPAAARKYLNGLVRIRPLEAALLYPVTLLPREMVGRLRRLKHAFPLRGSRL